MERAKVSKTERLLNLISYMLRSAQPIPFSEIAGKVVGYDDEARLDSIEKRFDRDKAELRNMGIPIEYVDGGSPENSGYVIPRDRFFLGRIELDAGDAILLSLAGRNSAVAHASPLVKEAFRSAMRKLSVDLPEVNEFAAEPASMMQIGSGHERASENLHVICTALFSRRTIRFSYSGAAFEKASARRLDPYGIGILRGDWYLVGRDRDKDAVRMFKIARIQGVVALTGNSDAMHEFEIPADFRIRDHLERDAWEFGDAAPVEVRVSMPRDLAETVRRQSRVEVVATEGDRSTVVISARSPERVVDWALSHGPEVRLLSPRHLGDLARRRVEAMLARYGAATNGKGR